MIGLEDNTSTGSCGVNNNSNTISTSFNLMALRTNPNPSGTSMDDENANFGPITDFHMEKLIGILEDAIQIVDEVFIDVCTAAVPSGTTASTVSSAELGAGQEAEAETEEESTTATATATINRSGNETSSHVQEHSA